MPYYRWTLLPIKTAAIRSSQSFHRPDICIGTDTFHTPKKLVDLLCSYMQSKGYTVSLNAPFPGSLVSIKHYGKDKRVASVMIEVYRNLYMNEHTCERIAGFKKIRKLTENSIDLLMST